MATPYERIAQARSRLVAAGLSAVDAGFDAEVLARHALGWDRATLLAHGREPAPADFVPAFDALIARRVQREPVAQIIGRREFWGRDFKVTRDVLVPRPETELIVEEALAFAEQFPCRSIAEVGTGSGCIAVSVACELPDVRVTAVDISEAALAIAQRNAELHAVTDRVTFHQADVLEGIEGAFDLVLSNPPYMPAADASTLQPEVLDYEPPTALFGGDDGLDVVRRLLADAPRVLAPGGRLILEFGMGQDRAVSEAAVAAGWRVLHIRKDLQGIPRTGVLARSAGL
jgi:release factor glutamine methyltransferase